VTCPSTPVFEDSVATALGPSDDDKGSTPDDVSFAGVLSLPDDALVDAFTSAPALLRAVTPVTGVGCVCPQPATRRTSPTDAPIVEKRFVVTGGVPGLR
jgi:hypothetical protein